MVEKRKDIKNKVVSVIISMVFILLIIALAKSIYVVVSNKRTSIDTDIETTTTDTDTDDNTDSEQQLQQFKFESIVTPTVESEPAVDLSKYNISKGYSDNYIAGIDQDLSCQIDISEEQIQQLLDYWCDDSGLDQPGVASAFIYASQITGYDPLFLLSLAGYESGWGTSRIHINKANVYSIGMTGNNDGLVFGDSLPVGIINGAIYIHDTYYEEADEKTLYDMQYGYLSYATDVNWMASVSAIMNESYYVLCEGG